MQHTEALKRLRALFRREDSSTSSDVLSGPNLLDQEPDLIREAGRSTVSASSWAAGHSHD